MTRPAVSRGVWALLFLLIGACKAEAPSSANFDPFPSGSAARYHFDLARNFYRTPELEASEGRLLEAGLKRFQQSSVGALENADSFLAAFRAQDSLYLDVTRHGAYLDSKYFADTRNTDASERAEELRVLAGESFAPFESVLVSKPDTFFTRMEGTQPTLRQYRFAVETLRRDAVHPGSSRADVGSKGRDRFFSTLNGTDFGFVQTPAGSLKVPQDWAAIASNPDRRVRREGYLRNQAGLTKNLDVYADILVGTAKSLNKAARTRGYADYPEETYADRLLTRDEVTKFLESIAAASEVNKRIERTMIDHYRHILDVDTVHVWDLTVPEPGMDAPKFTITEATQAVLEATKPLGEGYTKELAKLLDPANGRMDIAPGPNKAQRQGFSTGLVGFPSLFYQGAFRGYVDDVVTLAHESGHAVQNMLMTSNGVLPRYAMGPSYFTESFAVFCEVLVLDHLYKTAPDKPHKIFYLQQLINQGPDGVFRNGWESLFEQHLFDRVGTDTTLTPDELEAMTQSTASRFSVWFGPQSERRQLAWLQPTQFFAWPLYHLNYVYARVLALRYFDLLQKNPQQFRDRYMGLLMNGYDAPPDTLLQRFVDMRLQDPALVDGAVHVLDSWLKELDALYAS
jgi:oligoendopeptidase F